MLVAVASALGVACGPRAEDYPFVREGCDASTGACGTEADAGPPPRIDAGPPEVPPEPLEPWDTTDEGPLSGIFAFEVTIPARVVVDVETRQVYRVRMLQRGREARVRVQPCRLVLPSIRGVADLALGAGANRVIQTKVVESEGTILSSDDPLGATFAPPVATVVLGAALADPVRDPLPTAADPSTAIDEDEDGHPGVTLHADAIVCRTPEDAYVAIRASVALEGVVTSLDAFEGAVVPTLDQSLLGTSRACLESAASIPIEIQPGARFRAVRVGDAQDLDGNGNVSCPEILWASAGMFGDYWLAVD